MGATVKVKPEEITILPPEVEEKVSNEILVIRSEANVTDDLIKNLKEEYGGLIIKDQSDKEGYLNVQAARKAVKKIRVAAEKLFDKGREEAVAVADKWLDSKKSVVAALKEIEDPLSKREEEWEEEDKRVKDERKTKIEQQGITRMKDMLKFGAELQGSNWVSGEVSYEAALVKEADDDIYQIIYEAFKAVFDEKEKDRLAKEAKDREDKAELIRQQDALKLQQKQARDMRTEGRVSILQSLGMGAMLVSNDEAFTYKNVTVWLRDVEEKNGQEWDVIIAEARTAVEKVKADATEKKRKSELFQARLARLKGWGYNGFTVSRPIGFSEDVAIAGSLEDLVKLSEEEFEGLVIENEKQLTDLEDKKEQKRLKDLEDARVEGIGKSRRQALTLISTSTDTSDMELGVLSEDKWNYLYGDFKAAYDKKQQELVDEKERLRLEELGEKQRYEEVVKYLKAVKIPDLKNGQLRSKVNAIKSFIDGLK